MEFEVLVYICSLCEDCYLFWWKIDLLLKLFINNCYVFIFVCFLDVKFIFLNGLDIWYVKFIRCLRNVWLGVIIW